MGGLADSSDDSRDIPVPILILTEKPKNKVGKTPGNVSKAFAYVIIDAIIVSRSLSDL